MKEIIDRLFPETKKQDVLGGVVDHSNGRARKYFSGLSPEDREIVQWYLTQRTEPLKTEDYAVGLVENYAVIDPERRYKDAINLAHRELERVESFVKIFLASADFFPVFRKNRVTVTDIDGRLNRIEEYGWSSITYYSLGDLDSIKEVVKSRTPLFSHMHAFLDDPNGAPFYFDQERILERFKLESQDVAELDS